MEKEEMMKEVMRDLLKDSVEEYLERVDFNKIAKEVIRDLLKDKIYSYFDSKSDNVVNAMIVNEIKETLNKPVHIDNGWGRKEDYSSFEDMFKQIFAKQLNSTYQITSIIEKTIRNEIDNIVKTKSKELNGKITDLILNEMAELK